MVKPRIIVNGATVKTGSVVITGLLKPAVPVPHQLSTHGDFIVGRVPVSEIRPHEP